MVSWPSVFPPFLQDYQRRAAFWPDVHLGILKSGTEAGKSIQYPKTYFITRYPFHITIVLILYFTTQISQFLKLIEFIPTFSLIPHASKRPLISFVNEILQLIETLSQLLMIYCTMIYCTI